MMNRRIVVSQFGGPGQLTLVESPDPEPALGQVRVRTLAAGVSYPDLLIREGTYPKGPKPPFTPGYDFVGVVDKPGPGVTSFAPGDTVAAIMVYGGYADAVCVPEAHLAPVPPGLDPAVAVCLAFNYITAYQMLMRTAAVRPGKRVLVHGAAGGVGSAAVEIGRAARLELYGTARGAGCRLVVDLGATPIDFATEDFVHRIHQLTKDGVDVVLDGIGGRVAIRSYRALAPHGLLVMFGHYSTLVKGRRSTKGMAAFYASGALAFGANGLPAGVASGRTKAPRPAIDTRMVPNRLGRLVPAVGRGPPPPTHCGPAAAHRCAKGTRAARPRGRAGQARPHPIAVGRSCTDPAGSK